MAFHIRDAEVDTLVRELARRKGVGLTDAVKLAVANELKRDVARVPLAERIRKIVEPLQAYPDEPRTESDKAFFDRLSGV
jgi:antitoxin VapB